MVVIKGIDRNGNIVQMQTNDRDRAAKFIAMLDKYYYDEPLPDEQEGVKLCDRNQATSLASLHQDDHLGGVRMVPINEEVGNA